MSKFKTKKKHQKNNIAKATKDIISKLAINLEENNEQIHHVAPKIGRKERRRKMKLERKLKRSKASTKTNDNKMFNKFGSRKRKNFTNADHGQCKKQKHDVPSVKLHKESTSIKENTSTGLTMDKIDQKERRKIKKQQKETLKKNEKLLKQNTEEDKTISKLEKLMYINTKKKKKNKLPSSFALDGLDYLLDVVNHTSNLSESDMSGKEDEVDSENTNKEENSDTHHSDQDDNLIDYYSNDEVDSEYGGSSSVETHDADDEMSDTFESDIESADDYQCEEDSSVAIEDKELKDCDLKNTSGEQFASVLPPKNVTKAESKYIPPAKRLQLMTTDDEKLRKLKRQIKGLLNRLSEANLHSICSEIQNIYHLNSRAIVTAALTDLILVQFHTPDPIPERLITESVMLVTVLTHNVGIETVAHFIETAAKILNNLLQKENYGSGKECNNILQLICSLYELKVIQKQIILDLIDLFVDSFKEKDIELVVLILKAVGFQLRKDDPVYLKRIIETVTFKSTKIAAQESLTRMKYMLDVLTAIKNNNVRKITEYDVDLINNRRKKVKAICQKEHDTFPDVKFQDLVDAETRGRWWIVGSAWTGAPMLKDAKLEQEGDPGSMVNSKLVRAGKKLRMNTDVRRKIFYAIMSSENVEEAFQNVLNIGLKGKQLREVAHVTVECCQQEQTFNPFYFHLLKKFCHYERQFVMSVQCSIWDRFKLLTSMSVQHHTNIATLLSNLILAEAIPLNCLKTIEYTEMNAQTVSFLREMLYNIAKNCTSPCQLDSIFGKLAANKQCLARQGLRLFLQHFMIRDPSYIKDHGDVQDALVRMDERLAAGKAKLYN